MQERQSYITEEGGQERFLIAVCDDEEYFRHLEEKRIAGYMKRHGYGYRIDTYASGREMLEQTAMIAQYDLIFLDISMEQPDGMETAKIIRRISPEVFIVFVTAYITWAPEGYKVGAVRYLLKESRGMDAALRECLDVVTDRMRRSKVQYEVDFPQGKKRILVEKILYVESRLHKVLFYVLEDGVREYYKYGRLDEVEEELHDHGFFRVHQSYLVNIKYVSHVERYTASLKNGIMVNISKRYYKDVEREYIRWQGEL